MAKNVLVVLTSHDTLGNSGHKTGFWLEELAAPYYRFKDAGVALTLASPKGGQPPLDPKSDLPEFQTDATRRFQADPAARADLAATVPLSAVDPASFDAIFFPGGHGPLWDLVDDPHSIALIEAFWAAGRPVAAVCHGPIVLSHAKDPSGDPIVKGRAVTAFSDAEEAAVELTDVVPHSVERVLRERGGAYQCAAAFAPFAVRDGQLITGQNPPSSEQAADLLLEALGVTTPAAA